MAKKIPYLIVSIFNEQKESALCITTSHKKAQAIGNTIFSSMQSVKTIVTLTLNDYKFQQIYLALYDRDFSLLLDNGYVIIPQRIYAMAFKMLELV
jgi:hypothetical protein